MPLFFFVSGFLAYKSSLVWDFPTLRTLLAKKVRVQTVPTVIFFLFAMAVLGSSFYPTEPAERDEGRLLVHHRPALYVHRLLPLLLS